MKRIIIVFVVLLIIIGLYVYGKSLVDADSDVIKMSDLGMTTDTIKTNIEVIEESSSAKASEDKQPVEEDETVKEYVTVEETESEPEKETTTITIKTIIPFEKQELSVTGALGTGVKKNTLIGEATEFDANVGKVYCLITLKGAKEPTQIEHVWYYKDKEKTRTTLPIKYKRHRTWSYKTIVPQWVGNWRVDVVDSAGQVLKSFSFIIKE